MEYEADDLKVKLLESHTIKTDYGGEESKLSKDCAVNSEDVAKQEHNTRKRRLSTTIDGDPIQMREKTYKRIILSLTKPSYLLRFGLSLKTLRHENRTRLRYLLRKLVRQHNWVDASGVLSVLLKGTTKEKCPLANRLKYMVSMELLNHVEGDSINPLRIKNVYDIWTKRIRSLRDSQVEETYVISLEFIIFCLARGDVEGANLAAMSLNGKHPMSNMFIALTAYELWLSRIPREMRWEMSDQTCSPMQSDLSRERSNSQYGNSEGHDVFFRHCNIPTEMRRPNFDQNYSPMQHDISGERFNHRGRSPGRNDTVYSHEVENDSRYDSETSVMIGKTVSMEIDYDLCREGAVEDQVKLQRENLSQNIKPQNFYLNSIENEASVSNEGGPVDLAPAFIALGAVESWLLPIHLPKSEEDYEKFMKNYKYVFNDEYKKAIEYLRLALYSTPPISAALLPFIQLLLIGGRVDEALKELDKFCNNLPTELPFRLRASLLDCFDSKNSCMLSTSFEEILKKDPTCQQSLARLISMHNNGDYSVDLLLEMIALHLDATFAAYDTWREFALCFLKVSQCEDDRLSVCFNGNEGEEKQKFSIRYNRIPNMFSQGKSGENWMLRCRWWLRRHFSKKILVSDIAAGDLRLLTYKAACASHMYGQEFHYVVKAHTSLQKESDMDLIAFLKTHMQNSIRLYSDHLSRK